MASGAGRDIENADALAARAQAAYGAGSYAEAAQALEALLALKPGDARTLCNLGLCRRWLGEPAVAVGHLRAACDTDPSLAEAWAHLGDMLRETGAPEEAERALRRAIELAPQNAAAHMGLGLLLTQYGHGSLAIGFLRRALELDPASAEGWCNLAAAMNDVGGVREALAAYRKALALAPGHAAAASNALMCMQYDAGLSARELRDAANRWGEDVLRRVRPVRMRDARRPGRLRIGYVSADFYQHPVGWFFLPVARGHDRDRFEVTCYANQTRSDELTSRIAGAVEHWVGVAGLDDDALAARIVEDDVDILVDLSGHTAGHRLGVFARRAGRGRLSWLGYFASTGLGVIDGVVYGEDQAAPGAEAFFVEAVERIPRCHFCYAPPDYAPAVARRPRAGIVFGAFGNLSKVNDAVVRVWAQLLHAVPDARLVLKWKTLGDDIVRGAMHARFAQAGIDPVRVELRGPSPHPDMLAQYGDIDVALDPFPFSGALTTFESLWMGVPPVTLEMQRPVARQTLAILRAIGLDDLIARTPADYVRIAARLGTDREHLDELRGGMRRRLESAGLLDGADLARRLEAVYLKHARRLGIVAPA